MRPNPNPEPKESLPPGIKFEHSIVDFFLRGPERRVPTFEAIKPEIALEIVERASRKALREEDLRKEVHKASLPPCSLFDFYTSLPLHSRDWTREVVLQELTREVGVSSAQEVVDSIVESVSKEDSDLDLDSLVDHGHNYPQIVLAWFRGEI